MVPLLRDMECRVITCRTDKAAKEAIMMTYITEDEEKQLDEGYDIRIKRGPYSFNVKPSDVECYGIIDFHRGSEDLEIIASFDWLRHLTFCGVVVPSNYDYENHCAYSDLKIARVYDTTRPEVVAQYFHGTLNKPERTLIFRYIIHG